MGILFLPLEILLIILQYDDLGIIEIRSLDLTCHALHQLIKSNQILFQKDAQTYHPRAVMAACRSNDFEMLQPALDAIRPLRYSALKNTLQKAFLCSSRFIERLIQAQVDSGRDRRRIIKGCFKAIESLMTIENRDDREDRQAVLDLYYGQLQASDAFQILEEYGLTWKVWVCSMRGGWISQYILQRLPLNETLLVRLFRDLLLEDIHLGVARFILEHTRPLNQLSMVWDPALKFAALHAQDMVGVLLQDKPTRHIFSAEATWMSAVFLAAQHRRTVSILHLFNYTSEIAPADICHGWAFAMHEALRWKDEPHISQLCVILRAIRPEHNVLVDALKSIDRHMYNNLLDDPLRYTLYSQAQAQNIARPELEPWIILSQPESIYLLIRLFSEIKNDTWIDKVIGTKAFKKHIHSIAETNSQIVSQDSSQGPQHLLEVLNRCRDTLCGDYKTLLRVFEDVILSVEEYSQPRFETLEPSSQFSKAICGRFPSAGAETETDTDTNLNTEDEDELNWFE